MSTRILPYPDQGDGTDTPRKIPTPAEVSAALTLIGAEQVAPGVWTAELSIGVTIRITDPAPESTPERLARRLDEIDAAYVALQARRNGGTDVAR